jgi:anthranilate phosphoribosyltransferase
MSDAIRHYTNEFRSRRDVSPYDAEFLFDQMISSEDEGLLVDLLSAWSLKGATEDELFRFASILRSRMKPVDRRGLACVDIFGTGGSTAKTFNVSTAAAFVVAGAGIPVAKHGNRAATSKTGSADVLTHLGIKVDIEPAVAEDDLHQHGICFMFAPRHHSLSATLAAARKKVGRPTIFNCIGPLANPARAGHQLIGVWDARLLNAIARVLFRLGTDRSWVVNNSGALDEIGTRGENQIVIVGDSIERRTLAASEYRLTSDESVPSAPSAKDSSSLIESILSGGRADSAEENIVVLNAAAAISLVIDCELDHAISMARTSIRDGAALNKLDALRKQK